MNCSYALTPGTWFTIKLYRLSGTCVCVDQLHYITKFEVIGHITSTLLIEYRVWAHLKYVSTLILRVTLGGEMREGTRVQHVAVAQFEVP